MCEKKPNNFLKVTCCWGIHTRSFKYIQTCEFAVRPTSWSFSARPSHSRTQTKTRASVYSVPASGKTIFTFCPTPTSPPSVSEDKTACKHEAVARLSDQRCRVSESIVGAFIISFYLRDKINCIAVTPYNNSNSTRETSPRVSRAVTSGWTSSLFDLLDKIWLHFCSTTAPP